MKKSALQIADTIREKYESPDALRKAAPWLTAAGAGALGYGLLRHKKFAPLGSQLRSLQEASKGNPFRIATDPVSTFSQKMQSLIFGSPVISTGKNVKGTVLHHTPSPKGGGDVEINTGNIVDSLYDKLTFDRVMREGVGTGAGMASALPNTMRLDEALKRVGGDPKRLKEIFPDFMLKARNESMGRGIFSSLDDKGVNEALQNPSHFIFQEKMPLKNEYRVHTLDNEPFTATHRFMPNKVLRGLWNRVAGGGGGAFVPLMGKRRKDLHDFIRKSTAHLKPSGGKSLSDVGESMHVAWDVAELPDGTFKLIEANPVPGTLMNPITARRLRRQVTGNWSRPISALGGAAVAAPTGILADKALDRFYPGQNDQMKKTAEQISLEVLLKCAAREGNPVIWRKIADAVARAKGFPPPTEQEFNEMFPSDWETRHPHTESAVMNSSWFQKHMASGIGSHKSRSYTGPIDADEDMRAKAVADAEREIDEQSQRAADAQATTLKVLNDAVKMDLAFGAMSTLGAGTTAMRGVRSAQQSKTPEERYAVLGLGGGLAGMSGGQAYKHFSRASLANEFRNMIAKPENFNIDRFKYLAEKVTENPKFLKPRYLGGLAGLGLGLGGAALWNYMDKNKKMDKAASITPEEIALGLAGKAARPEITREEIAELGKKIKEEELLRHKWDPVKQGIGGGILGGALGRIHPRATRLGTVPGILVGAGLGVGVGGLTGTLERYFSGVLGEGRGELLGRTARTGRMSREDRGVYGVDELVPYAIGTQPGATPMSEEKTQKLRNRVLKRNMLSGLAISALPALLAGYGTHNMGLPISSSIDAAAASLIGGAGGGAFASPGKSNTIVDLHNRGYGRLARQLENE